MTSAFSDSLMEPGGEHPRISSTPKGMTMKFLAVVGIYREAPNKKSKTKCI